MAISTSTGYKTAIKADTELTRLESEFGFYPTGSIENAVVSSNDASSVSRLSQLKDGVKQTKKFASAELNRWILNGTFEFIDTDDSSMQVGDWSEIISGTDRTFSDPKPAYTYTLNTSYDIVGVTLFFDSAGNEWATNITIAYYNSSETLIESETFTNDSTVMAVEMPATGVKKIVATINEWCLPGRHVKCCEILPGETFLFTPDNTFSFEFHEIIQPFETSLETPYFTIEFDNSEKKFDIVNPSGLVSYLRQKMQMLSKIGLDVDSVFEYISTGNFYLYEWPDEAQNDTAKFTCRPEMAFKSSVYYVAPDTGTQTVATAASIIFTTAGITSYTVDSTLQDITVNQYIGENVPLLNAMGQLAIAAGGYWKFNRDGSYSLLPIEILADSTDTIDYDNMWEKPDITQEKKYTSVNVKYYTVVSESFNEHNSKVTATTDDGETASDITSCFIPSAARAIAIGNLALEYYAMRLSYSVDYRGDMSMEAGDVLSIENDYGTSDMLVLEHDIKWDTGDKLTASFTGIGGT